MIIEPYRGQAQPENDLICPSLSVACIPTISNVRRKRVGWGLFSAADEYTFGGVVCVFSLWD